MNLMQFRSAVTSGFMHHKSGGVEYLTSPLLERTGLVRHAFFARNGGVSRGEFASLNFSFKRENNRENVIANYGIAADTLGLDVHKCVTINYEHGSNVLLVDAADAGAGVFAPPTAVHSDGLAANSPGVTLVTIHADCLPLFFLDTRSRTIALCHAGWRGVYSHITLKAIDTLIGLGAQPKDIICAVGPAIGRCCFEVSRELEQKFIGEFGRETAGSRHVDLALCVLSDMMCAGVLPENVNTADECTCCDAARYFSHRRDAGATGSMASFMALL